MKIAAPAVHPQDGLASVSSFGYRVPASAAARCAGGRAKVSIVDTLAPKAYPRGCGSGIEVSVRQLLRDPCCARITVDDIRRRTDTITASGAGYLLGRGHCRIATG